MSVVDKIEKAAPSMKGRLRGPSTAAGGGLIAIGLGLIGGQDQFSRYMGMVAIGLGIAAMYMRECGIIPGRGDE